MINVPDNTILDCATSRAWNAWLKKNHAGSSGVWLRIAKKNSGVKSVSHADALEVALCFGWIDAKRVGHDAKSFLQRFTPRKPKSGWSKVNREKAIALIAAGKMQPAGLRAIERAKANGNWDAAYDAASTITIPPDLQVAFDANPRAAKFFTTLNAQNRYSVLHRIQTAKKPEARAARIEKYVAMLGRWEKLHP